MGDLLEYKKTGSICIYKCQEDEHDWSISLVSFVWVGQDKKNRQLAKVEIVGLMCKKCGEYKDET